MKSRLNSFFLIIGTYVHSHIAFLVFVINENDVINFLFHVTLFQLYLINFLLLFLNFVYLDKNHNRSTSFFDIEKIQNF